MKPLQARFALRGHNPDVLTCIANLSNDEVFTPPELANQMLDTLAEAWAVDNNGADIWSDPNVTFLDPCTKSGVFLREITSRLTDGLAGQIPDLQERVDHILTKQVFGIAITHLTSLLARRSVYCSRHANGTHSIVNEFGSESGNIWFERTEHSWTGGTGGILTADAEGNPINKYTNGKCLYCGASQMTLDRDPDQETYAYPFIHVDNEGKLIRELVGKNMQFDVIVGNPPYQLSDGGHGASAIPIYNKFVDQAKALEPRYLTMVIPARWFFGGRGLDSFRKSMLSDRRVRYLADFPDSRSAFSGVDVAGGVCFFLWARDSEDECTVETFESTGRSSSQKRPLLEEGADVFVRNNESISILRKIAKSEGQAAGITLPVTKSFSRQVTGQKPFGLRTYFRGSETRESPDDLCVLQAGGHSWTPRHSVVDSVDLIDKWKVFTSKSSSEHAGQVDKSGMRRVLSLSGVIPPGSVVTETYVILGSFDSEQEARNCLTYACTKLFRFLVATRSSAQDLPRSAYSFVPTQDFSTAWSDELLYQKYGLSDREIEVVESTIRPMEIPCDPVN